MPLISVSGASCTGKSTIVGALAQRLGGNPSTLIDGPRDAFDVIGWQFPQADLKGYQDYLGLRQYVEETRASKSDATVLCDKSLIDALAYWRVLVRAGDPAWAQALSSNRYIGVVICDPADFKIEAADPYQQHHWGLRAELHAQILRVIDAFGLKHVVVRGSHDARLDVAVKFIESLAI